MPRILIVNKYFAPDIGGVETVVRQYADWLASTGECDVVILCCSKKFAWRTSVSDYKGIKLVRCASFCTWMGMPISLSFFFWFFYYATRSGVVNIHYPFPLADIAMALTPKYFRLFYTVHANISGKGRLGDLVKKLSVFGVRKADNLALTSEPLSKIFFPDLSVTRTVIPLCLSAEDQSERQGTPLSIDLPKRYSLFFGRLSRYKGLDVLLKAAVQRHSKQLPIVIAGHGPLASELKTFLGKEPKLQNVHFYEHIFTEAEKDEILSRADFLLFPSTTEAEAFGIIQLEALIRGVPIINTYLGTGVEWVSLDGVTGLTVQPNDAHALADAIDRLALEEPLRARFAVAARIRAQQFSEDLVRDKVLALFNIVAPAPVVPHTS